MEFAICATFTGFDDGRYWPCDLTVRDVVNRITAHSLPFEATNPGDSEYIYLEGAWSESFDVSLSVVLGRDAFESLFIEDLEEIEP